MFKVKKSAAPLTDAREQLVKAVKSFIGMIHALSIRLFAREQRKNYQISVVPYVM